MESKTDRADRGAALGMSERSSVARSSESLCTRMRENKGQSRKVSTTKVLLVSSACAVPPCVPIPSEGRGRVERKGSDEGYWQK